MSITPSRCILVPLDGSAFAEQALPLAVTIARRTNAILQLALVHHPVPALALAVEVPDIDAALDDDTRSREHNYITETARRLHDDYNIPVSGVVLDGVVADALCQQVEASGADLVLSTTHGRGQLSRLWLGSVADQLMRRLPVPVLLLRPQEKADAANVPPIKRITVAVDGSPFAEQALELAASFARIFDAVLDLLFVVEPPAPIADPSGLMVIPPMAEAEANLRKQAVAYLDRVARRLAAEGLAVETNAVDGANPASTILQHSAKQNAGLIALATHGAGGLERLMVGSVADKVIRGATTPVLVVRPAVH
ncbi:MAG: universal stress protein [Gemmatimonadales bacterium]